MPMAKVGPVARRSAHSLGGGLQAVGGDDLVHQADAQRILGGEIVAEEDQLLGLRQADQARQQVGAAGVDGDAAAHEHLDEARVGGGDDEVAGERQVRAETGGDAVDRRDHRLLQLPERADQALRARAHHFARRARAGRSAAARGSDRRRCRTPCRRR